MISGQNKNLEKSILNTILYFDIFNFPLTSFEIWKNLYSKNKVNLSDIVYELENNNFLKEKLGFKDSFYFLKQREDIVDKRKNNYLSTYRKYKKGLNFINLISNLDCIKSVFIANSLSIENGREDSDIDLLIIAKKESIWTARFITTFLAEIFGLRPNNITKKDKICLTIFIEENNLNLKKVCSNNDIYYIYWINQIVPIYDEENIYKKFIETNSWSRENIQNIFDNNTGFKRIIKNNKSKLFWRKITKILSNKFLENIFKKIQINIFPKDIKQKIKEGKSEDVVVDDTIIKLHNNNNRSYFQDLFSKRIIN